MDAFLDALNAHRKTRSIESWQRLKDAARRVKALQPSFRFDVAKESVEPHV
jgi:hypothetical protein